MKVAISYPPLESSKGIPLLSQNRQFQWFSNPTYIYPIVPASAATLLAQQGHHIYWDDAIAEGLDYESWQKRLIARQPDIVVLESKTPVIKRHWRIIAALKEISPHLTTVLVGDHVSALPEESFAHCPVDYVIAGGDYDFILAKLCTALAAKQPQPLPPGVWYRGQEKIESSGAPGMQHDLNSLPIIDRELSRWKLYAYKNGNFKYTPGAYVMAGRDCWWGRCSFCSWTTLYPGSTYRTVSVERHLDEIGRLISEYGVREIFDDSGCFPKGNWLEEFCQGSIARGYGKKARLGCNMRVGTLDTGQWRLMKQAGFRFVLIGLESVNQATLDRLNKGIRVEQIEQTIRAAKSAGLEPHITTMVGYPWESKEDARATIGFARRMFAKGYLDTLQATIVVPYPGTPLFEEARKNDWLTTQDWDDYDMRQSVWKSPVGTREVMAFTQDLYKAALNPAFLMRKLINIRSLDDIAFLQRAGRKVVGHLMDFSKNNTA